MGAGGRTAPRPSRSATSLSTARSAGSRWPAAPCGSSRPSTGCCTRSRSTPAGRRPTSRAAPGVGRARRCQPAGSAQRGPQARRRRQTGVHPHRARARLPHAETGTSRDRRRRPGAPKATVTLFVMHPPDPSSAGLPGALTSGWEEVCAPLAGWTAAGPRCVSLRRGRDRAAPAALRSPNLSLAPPAAGLGRPAAASGGPPVFERTLSSCPNTGTRTAAVIGAPATVHFGGSAASWRSSRR